MAQTLGGEMFRPETEDQVLEAVSWAVSEQAPLEVLGHGTKRGIGRPLQVANGLDISGLTGITLYEPEELVLTARAGTSLEEIEARLAEHNQEFAFEPMDYRALLGSQDRPRGTAGAVLATNLSGPRRLKAGAARDHVLGIRAVTGRGDLIKSGGRVVKNVTGYDLPRGLSGSWGTLAVLTEVTFKVLPRAETEETLVVSGLNDADAADIMAQAMGSDAEVSSAAHLPESVRGRFINGALPGSAATVLRLEGFPSSVAYRLGKLEAMFAQHGSCSRLDADASRALWREIRDVKPFCDGTTRPVWRVSVAPGAGHQLVAGLRLQTGVDAFYDWQGGLVWLRMEGDDEAGPVRDAIRALGGGHATLVRGSGDLRNHVPVFEPQEPALAALTRRLKEQFDPQAVLNPGRMWAEL
ncbi:glycolate oxidase subunit GlcE [Hoeflea prorocentri]|uniref:Glycolate oxidase subunit GlcE n=1 Tax=Hoeflea prorocentri TaxID=1922333 RepID=A0A9X3UN55_9HYPH|nr:glycolate oxidase subunit GlcE [Hoeflea prorocentri]MCY6382279.1 glycolate oxidase subunit GlcE [Hoeflea prorocentri]MDA5400079.1 glycolate oxidase subunit GlcE [Hoeflea prorocentri]